MDYTHAAEAEDTLSLPDPDNWRPGGRRLAFVTAAVAVFVGLGVYFGIRNLLRGQPLSALVILGVLLPFVLILIAVHRVASGRTALRDNTDPTGTTLRADRGFSLLVVLALAVLIPVGVFMVLTTVTGDLQLFTSARGRVVSVVLMSAATLIAAGGLISAWRRGGIGSVTLTSDGVEIADIVRTTNVSWDGVVAVDDHSDSKKTRKAVVLRCSDGGESVIDGADFYVPNGAGLYWMVRHYWRHAQDRGELTDGRAVQKLSEDGFEVD
jgi:hypothetical protein